MDTGSSGLAFCLFRGDRAEIGVEPLTIVISFDAGKQAVPGSVPGWTTGFMHELGFNRALLIRSTAQSRSRGTELVAPVARGGGAGYALRFGLAGCGVMAIKLWLALHLVPPKIISGLYRLSCLDGAPGPLRTASAAETKARALAAQAPNVEGPSNRHLNRYA